MDEQRHTDSELEIDTDTDEAADTEAADIGEHYNDSDDEQEQDTLTSDPPSKESKAEAVREKQAEAWARNISNGRKTLDDLPHDLKWLKPYVEAKLGTTAPQEDIDAKVEEILTRKEEEKALRSLVRDLNESLPKSKRIELKEKQEYFFSKGLSPLDALETAMEALNVDLEEDRIDARRQAARLRTPGRYRAPGKDATPEEMHEKEGFGAVYKTVSPEKQLEYLKKLRGIR